MFTTAIWFLVLEGAGLALIVYTEPVKRFTGSLDFAEKYLGAGGTYNFIKLMGVFLMIIGLFYVTGTLDRLVPDFFERSITGQGIS